MYPEFALSVPLAANPIYLLLRPNSNPRMDLHIHVNSAFRFQGSQLPLSANVRSYSSLVNSWPFILLAREKILLKEHFEKIQSFVMDREFDSREGGASTYWHLVFCRLCAAFCKLCWSLYFVLSKTNEESLPLAALPPPAHCCLKSFGRSERQEELWCQPIPCQVVTH